MFIAQGMNEIKKKEKTDVVVQKRTHETDVWTLWRGNSPKLSIDILNDDILKHGIEWHVLRCVYNIISFRIYIKKMTMSAG